MIAWRGWPSAVFFIETMAISAPTVAVGTWTARTLGRLRRSALRISASREMLEIRMWSEAVPEATEWNIASLRIWIRSATKTFSVDR